MYSGHNGYGVFWGADDGWVYVVYRRSTLNPRNPKPSTPSPTPQTLNPIIKRQTLNPKTSTQTLNPKPYTPNPKTKTELTWLCFSAACSQSRTFSGG